MGLTGGRLPARIEPDLSSRVLVRVAVVVVIDVVVSRSVVCRRRDSDALEPLAVRLVVVMEGGGEATGRSSGRLSGLSRAVEDAVRFRDVVVDSRDGAFRRESAIEGFLVCEDICIKYLSIV